MDHSDQIVNYYTSPGLHRKITEIISGKPETPLSFFDELHTGGRRATEAFADAMDFPASIKILDIGSGLGGPARFFSTHCQSHVTGIDITPDFVETARRLSDDLDMTDAIDFMIGDAAALPFRDSSFDGGYTIHTLMNVENKLACLSEASRVLKPGAHFGIYDIFYNHDRPSPQYPLPWAKDASYSWLSSFQDFKNHLQDAGFEIIKTHDTTPGSIASLTRLNAGALSEPHPVFGRDFFLKTGNLLDALEAGLCTSIMIVCRLLKSE